MTQQTGPNDCDTILPKTTSPGLNPAETDDEPRLPLEAKLHFRILMALTSVAQRRAAGEHLPTVAHLISSSDDSSPPSTSSGSPARPSPVLHEAPATARADTIIPELKTGTKRSARDDDKQRGAGKTKAVRKEFRVRPDEMKRPAADSLQEANEKLARRSPHDGASQLQLGWQDGSVLTAREVKAQKKTREREAKKLAAAEDRSATQSNPPTKRFEFSYPSKNIEHPLHTFGHQTQHAGPSQQLLASAKISARPETALAQPPQSLGHPGSSPHPGQIAQNPVNVPDNRGAFAALRPLQVVRQSEPARAEHALAVRLWGFKGKGKAKEDVTSPEAMEGLMNLRHALPESIPRPPRYRRRYITPPHVGPSSWTQYIREKRYPALRYASAPRNGEDDRTYDFYHPRK